MAKLTVLVGLPGSGKSTLIRQAFPDIPEDRRPEDFHAHAHGNSPQVEDSRHYRKIVHHLRAGRDCVVADIAFTEAPHLQAVEQAFRADVPGVVISWVFFANDPRQCMTNVLGDVSRTDWPDRARAILDWSPGYTYPDGADVRAVHPAFRVVGGDCPPSTRWGPGR